MTKTTILLTRHGETLWNYERRLQGQQDSPLTETGKMQALTAGKVLSNYPITVAYSSPLKRASDTAALAGFSEAVPDARLMEIDLGIWEGLTFTELCARYPSGYASFELGTPDSSLSGGESVEDVASRVMEALNNYVTTHSGGTVAVFSHYITISCALCIASGTPINQRRTFHIENSALQVLECVNNIWSVKSLNHNGDNR
ncbi:MAG: histidine phosphatase family protein [Bacillota bacterium]